MLDPIDAGNRLQLARQAAGLSQGEAAHRLGMTRQQLSGIETGRRVPSWVRVVDIVTTLGLDPTVVVPEFFDPA